MNIAIGFGLTEAAFEKQETEAFIAHVNEQYKAKGLSYITDEFVDEMGAWLETRAKEYRKVADSYKETASFPSRYSYFHSHMASSASCIVGIFKFSHINRRHAMSPDGWAILQNERTAHVFSYDIQ